MSTKLNGYAKLGYALMLCTALLYGGWSVGTVALALALLIGGGTLVMVGGTVEKLEHRVEALTAKLEEVRGKPVEWEIGVYRIKD